LLVDDEAYAVDFVAVITLARLVIVELDDVAEARTAPALHADAHHRIRRAAFGELLTRASRRGRSDDQSLLRRARQGGRPSARGRRRRGGRGNGGRLHQ